MDQSVLVPVGYEDTSISSASATELALTKETFAAFLLNHSTKTALVYKTEVLSFIEFIKLNFGIATLTELRSP